jgi:hypothetical protein
MEKSVIYSLLKGFYSLFDIHGDDVVTQSDGLVDIASSQREVLLEGMTRCRVLNQCLFVCNTNVGELINGYQFQGYFLNKAKSFSSRQFKYRHLIEIG